MKLRRILLLLGTFILYAQAAYLLGIAYSLLHPGTDDWVLALTTFVFCVVLYFPQVMIAVGLNLNDSHDQGKIGMSPLLVFPLIALTVTIWIDFYRNIWLTNFGRDFGLGVFAWVIVVAAVIVTLYSGWALLKVRK